MISRSVGLNSTRAACALRRRLRVRELGALGAARGARGVEDDRGVALARARRPRAADRARQELLEAAGLHEDAFGAASRAPASASFAKLVPGEEDLGPGVRQVVRHLAPLQKHVHRHDHAPGAQHAVVGEREVGDVGKHDAHALARPHAALAQESGHSRATFIQRRVAQLTVAELHRDALGGALRAGGQDVGEVAAHLRCPLLGVARSIRHTAASRALPA